MIWTWYKRDSNRLGVWYLKQVGTASQGSGEGISTVAACKLRWVPRLCVTTVRRPLLIAYRSGLPPYPDALP